MVRMIKMGDGLVPFDEEAKRAIDKLSRGVFIYCRINKPRNYKHHKKFFKLLDIVAESIDGDITTDIMLEFIKEKLGFYDEVVVGDMHIKQYKSISFSKMSQIEFEAFYDRALDVLSHLVSYDSETLRKITEDKLLHDERKNK